MQMTTPAQNDPRAENIKCGREEFASGLPASITIAPFIEALSHRNVAYVQRKI
jgi:hypothetical protein